MRRNPMVFRAVAVILAAAAPAFMVPTALAQSNTVGSIYGTTQATAGDEVLVESAGTGFKRTIKPDAGGRFNLNSVPTGTYTVSLIRKGNVVASKTASKCV